MPRMNGWDAARSIRAMNRPDAEIIPIIAMSANIALIKTTGTLQCTAVFLLFFMPKFVAHGGVTLYIITCVLTRVMNGAILSKLELQKKLREPHENG